MSKAIADEKRTQKTSVKLRYEKPCLTAVDLYADEIMGGCQYDVTCVPQLPPGEPGPVSGSG